jgi:hypothetical protein
MSLAAKLPYDHPYAGGFSGIGSQPLPTDADAIDYLSRMAAADGAGVETGVAVAVDAFFRDTKAAGVFSALKACCILAGARTLAGALIPVVGDAPTNVADGFVEGDYSRTAGLTGDGTSYIDSGRANDDDPVNDNHNAAYVTAANTLGAGSYIGASLGLQGGANNLSSDPANTRIFTRNRSDAAELFVGKQSAVGLLGVSRPGAANYIARIEGSDTTINAASIGASPDNLFVFARNVGGSPNQTTDATIAFYSIGTSLDLAKLDSHVSAYVTAIGAAI